MAKEWTSGLHGCLDIKTESPLDPWNYTICVSAACIQNCITGLALCSVDCLMS